MTGRPVRSRAILVTLGYVAVAAAGCGVPDGDADRHVVEAATCAVLLERTGRPADDVDPARFAEALADVRDSGRPWSTIEPFLRACRSFG